MSRVGSSVPLLLTLLKPPLSRLKSLWIWRQVLWVLQLLLLQTKTGSAPAQKGVVLTG